MFVKHEELICALVDAELFGINFNGLLEVRLCLLDQDHAKRAHHAVRYLALPWARVPAQDREARLTTQPIADLLTYDLLEQSLFQRGLPTRTDGLTVTQLHTCLERFVPHLAVVASDVLLEWDLSEQTSSIGHGRLFPTPFGRT